jgi:hypothetical protein
MSSVNIPITGDASSLQNATTKAKQALNDLGDNASKNGAKLDGALGGAASTAQKAAMAMGPLGGILSRISPAAGAVASTVAGAASALTGLTSAGTAAGLSMATMITILGPVTVAVAALGGAYYLLSKDLEAVDAKNKAVADSTEKMAAMYKKVTDERRSLEDRAAIATGKHTKQEIELRDAVNSIAANYKPLLDAKKGDIEATKQLNLQMSRDMQNASQAILIEPKKAEVHKATTKAVKEQTDALYDWGAELKRIVDDGVAGEQLLAKSTHDDELATMSAMDAEQTRYREKIAGLTAARDAMLAAGEDEKRANDELNAALFAADKVHAEQVADIRKQQSDDAFAFRQQQLDDASTIAGASIGLAKSVAEATAKTYDTTTQAGRNAAEAQFKAQKAFAIATVIAEGAVAITKAVGSAPPPANIPAIAATSIAVGAELVTAASAQPKFHMGTTNYRPDEGSAVLQRGEGVVTSAGMNKPGMREAVSAANSGRTPFAADRAQPVQYQHRVFNEFIRDNLKQGSPVTRRIDSSAIVGHRVRR